MEPNRTFVRRAGLGALAALLVLGASACSDGGIRSAPSAATVNGSEITQDEVVAATKATKRFYEYSIKQGQDSNGELTTLVESLQGASADSVGTEGAAQVLSDMIVDEVIRQELTKRKALPTKADRDALRTEIETSVGGAAELKKLDAEYIDLYIERKVLNDAFAAWAASEADKDVEPLTNEEREAQMRALFEQTNPTRPLCLNAIQTATEDEAAAARARVDDGEDFVAVSKALAPAGTNVPDEGLVACLGFDEAQTAFGQDFSTAKVGDVVGPAPYTSQEGAAPVYLVLRVDSLDGQTYEEMLPQLEQAIPAEPAPTDPAQFDASVALDKVLKAAEIDVNPTVGRWSPKQQSVVPPKVPGATTTTTAVVQTIPGS